MRLRAGLSMCCGSGTPARNDSEAEPELVVRVSYVGMAKPGQPGIARVADRNVERRFFFSTSKKRHFLAKSRLMFR
jgi:hypothetical protein